MAAQHRPRRGRRGLFAATAAALAALALVLAPTALDGTRASFSATTANAGDELATGQVQPPSGLTVAQSCAAASSITQRTATTDDGTASVVLPMPSGTTTGDLLVAHVAYHDGAVILGAPSGWVRLGQTTDGGQHVTSAVYWKVAAAGEPTAVFSHPDGATGVMAAGLIAFVGARPTAPAIAAATNSGTTATTPSLTTTATGVTVAHLFSKTREALPAPTGMTNRYQRASGTGTGNVGVSAAVETFAGPGSTPSRSATSTTGDSSAWVAQALVLQRVRDTPSAQLSWTASPSSWASGYVLDRVVGGSVQATAMPPGVATVSATQGPLVNGTAYTFRLTTARDTWRSTSVTTLLTPNC